MTFGGNHVDELISASLSGDLTDAERAEMDAHLARCEKCRATLAAFKTERRILAALPPGSPPRDLSARVRGGIESRRLGGPWWRRQGSAVPLLASAAVFSAVILAVVILGKLPTGPVGQASGSPGATLSSAPVGSVAESSAPSAGPTLPPAFLASGQLGYLELGAAPFQASHLTFINNATGALIEVGRIGTVYDAPIAASLSPDGQWLAYITQRGETGANVIWALHLTDGSLTALGCSLAIPFVDRLTWSPFGDLLAFTVAAVDLGTDAGCPQPTDPLGTTRVWLFSVVDRVAAPLLDAGTDAYAASFERIDLPDAANRLWISHPGETPRSELVAVAWPARSVETLVRVEGMFVPMVAPDGNRVLFWRGRMTGQPGSEWTFARGGMPYVSGDRSTIVDASVWNGNQLFADIVPVGGEAFASGKFTWGPLSDQIAFWDGAWTGLPQSADGTYPSQQDVYVGRISTGLLSKASKLGLLRPDDSNVVDVAFSSDGTMVAVTIGLPSAGIGDPPSAYLEIVPLDGSTPYTVGGGVDPPPWDGPAVFGR